MKLLILIIFIFLIFFSYSIYSNENFSFSGKIKCELSATFIIFDFDNKIAIRNNYDSSKYKLSNYETKKGKFKEIIHTFSWYDLKDNFLGYWVMSDDSKNIEEIKFDRKGEIFSVGRLCSLFVDKLPSRKDAVCHPDSFSTSIIIEDVSIYGNVGYYGGGIGTNIPLTLNFRLILFSDVMTGFSGTEFEILRLNIMSW